MFASCKSFGWFTPLAIARPSCHGTAREGPLPGEFPGRPQTRYQAVTSHDKSERPPCHAKLTPLATYRVCQYNGHILHDEGDSTEAVVRFPQPGLSIIPLSAIALRRHGPSDRIPAPCLSKICSIATRPVTVHWSLLKWFRRAGAVCSAESAPSTVPSTSTCAVTPGEPKPSTTATD